jgi:hypothetical protein
MVDAVSKNAEVSGDLTLNKLDSVLLQQWDEAKTRRNETKSDNATNTYSSGSSDAQREPSDHEEQKATAM